jgi:hypothetical protein
LLNNSFIYLDLSDQTIARLPIRDNIKRRIRKLRENKNVTTAPTDLHFTSIPTSLTETIRHDIFLRCDTGPGMFFYVVKIVFSISYCFCLLKMMIEY